MLLNILNRKEKLKFLDLALHMVAVDGEPTVLEQRVLDLLVAEVGTDIVSEYKFSLSDNLEETLNYFKDSSLPVKNVVFLNLLKITMNDDLYNTLEHFFLEEVRERFEITEAKKNQIMRLLFDERDLKDRIFRLIKN